MSQPEINWIPMVYTLPHSGNRTYKGYLNRLYVVSRFRKNVLVHPDDVERLGLTGYFELPETEQRTEPPKEEVEVVVNNTKQMNDVDVADSAAKLANEYGVDLSSVSGTGKDGRILKRDVQAVLDERA